MFIDSLPPTHAGEFSRGNIFVDFNNKSYLWGKNVWLVSLLLLIMQ